MNSVTYMSIDNVITLLKKRLYHYGHLIQTEKWQGQEIDERHKMWEILHTSFATDIPCDLNNLKNAIKPNLPWADDHFDERVSGIPANPGTTYTQWPFYPKHNDVAIRNNTFTHTYMERFWPKFAGKDRMDFHMGPRRGIRYDYGDLQDVMNLLCKEPHTRQAYLPIWFPEDTGASHGGRVPCTLGYHFIMRAGQLDITYYIRSCDIIRHLADDIYMACLLLYHVRDYFNTNSDFEYSIIPGKLVMHITSLHCFAPEKALLIK